MQFNQILGQTKATDQVIKAIREERLPHALMLTGPEGIGKLPMALAIAQYVNCENPSGTDSCGTCGSCRKISKGIHPDLKYVFPIISKKEGGRQFLTEDYLSQFRELFQAEPYMSYESWQRGLGGENKQLFISVHEIRALKQKIYLKAFEAKYKILVVWQAETMNVQAANAFLKLLEEPPDQTLILMICSDTSKLLKTIKSRVQQIPLQRLQSEVIQQYLLKKEEISADAAAEIAAIAEGSMGRAFEYLGENSQQLNNTYVNWMRAVYTGRYDKIMDALTPVAKESKEYQKLFLTVAVKKMRDSMLFQLGLENIALSTASEKEFQKKFSQFINPAKAEFITKALEEGRRHISGNARSELVLGTLSMEIHRALRA